MCCNRWFSLRWLIDKHILYGCARSPNVKYNTKALLLVVNNVALFYTFYSKSVFILIQQKYYSSRSLFVQTGLKSFHLSWRNETSPFVSLVTSYFNNTLFSTFLIWEDKITLCWFLNLCKGMQTLALKCSFLWPFFKIYLFLFFIGRRERWRLWRTWPFIVSGSINLGEKWGEDPGVLSEYSVILTLLFSILEAWVKG